MQFLGRTEIGGGVHVKFGDSADEIAEKTAAKLVASMTSAAKRRRLLEPALNGKQFLNLQDIDFDQAMVELTNAVSIALDVIAKGECGSNQEAFVEDVLKRLAETTKTGDYDGGAKAVDDALAELDWRDAANRRAGVCSKRA